MDLLCTVRSAQPLVSALLCQVIINHLLLSLFNGDTAASLIQPLLPSALLLGFVTDNNQQSLFHQHSVLQVDPVENESHQ